MPDHLVEILARFTRNLRESSSVDQRSGVSARFAIAGAETIAAAALHRATTQGEDEPVARVVDLETAVDVLGGKIEFETGEEGREREILDHLLRTATAETVRGHFRGLDFALLVDAIEGGAMVTTGEQVTARDFLTGLPVLGESELYDDVCDRLDATQRRPAGRRDRARARGALPRPQDRQGHRRRRDRLWLTSSCDGPPATTPTPCVRLGAVVVPATYASAVTGVRRAHASSTWWSPEAARPVAGHRSRTGSPRTRRSSPSASPTSAPATTGR